MYRALANDIENTIGRVIGTGQCVALVQAIAHAPLTKFWKPGIKVRGADLPLGTVIATFDPDGHYGNHTDGRSHAAIYVGQDEFAIRVVDQWLKQPSHHRSIRFTTVPTTRPVNDGNHYFVVESNSEPKTPKVENPQQTKEQSHG